MRVVIASGKGGTGKTTVATNLARLTARQGRSVVYADCDVEEPNGHLFLKPVLAGTKVVNKLVPVVNADRCNGCGHCARFCQFHALVCLRTRVTAYPDLCHACGGCQRVCRREAIEYVPSAVGDVEWGQAGGIGFYQGRLRLGEARSAPVISAVKATIKPADLVILDAPPGTSCPVVETVRRADYLLLVTEPTPFGLHDLRLALEMARSLKMDCGVVINRALEKRPEAREFCRESRVPVLAEIPENLAVAKAYSEGRLAVDAVPELQKPFTNLLSNLLCRS